MKKIESTKIVLLMNYYNQAVDSYNNTESDSVKLIAQELMNDCIANINSLLPKQVEL